MLTMKAFRTLALGAIGVVFGDIGTSPLYALKESFIGHHPLAVDPAHIFGVLSLIFWTMMLIVTRQVRRRDPARRQQGRGRQPGAAGADHAQAGARALDAGAWPMLGVLATALFYGDAMITPAISVLSAVEGLTVVDDGLDAAGAADCRRDPDRAVRDPVARHSGGRASCSARSCWSTSPSLAVLGVAGIAGAPGDPLRRSIPCYALDFFLLDPIAGLPRAGLGGARRDRRRSALCRHGPFRAQGDRRSRWLYARLPVPDAQLSGAGARCCCATPAAVENPFFLMAPDWARLPLVILATLATIIASQAVISGAFSVIAAGGPARLPAAPARSCTPAPKAAGQIYVPLVNWALLVLVILLCSASGSSSSLAAAYGIAVTGTMFITALHAGAC